MEKEEDGPSTCMGQKSVEGGEGRGREQIENL